MATERSRWLQILLVLFVTSELVGLWAGWWFYGLVDRVVPEAAMSQANRLGALQLYLWRGGVLGLVVFGWSLLGIIAGRWVWPRTRPAEVP